MAQPTTDSRIIVLTGGPGAGKTTVARALAQRDARFVVVAEAATQVYGRLGTRWDRLSVDGRRLVQRQIYALQLEQEGRCLAENPGRFLLADRGTVDGSTYWPDGPADYWRAMNTTGPAEMSRYHAVIWMQTCAALGHYDGELSNPVRHENAPAAIHRGSLLEDIWKSHPRFHKIVAYPRIEQKIAAVAQLLEEIIGTGRSR